MMEGRRTRRATVPLTQGALRAPRHFASWSPARAAHAAAAPWITAPAGTRARYVASVSTE
jgi:hypothetical protein